MSNFNILSIDYAAEDAPAQFVRSLHETGFAVIDNHPIDVTAIDAMYREWSVFFKQDEKYSFATGPDVMYGYYNYKSENAKGNAYKDLKEFYHVYQKDPVPSPVEPTTRRFHQELLDIGHQLLRWLDTRSPERVRESLSEPLERMVEGSQRNLLRVLHYPPLDDAVDPHEERAAPHEDINLITLLVTGSQPGLQARDTAGHWHEVPCHTGMITVNAGDMLERATQGYYPATTHRVVNPNINDGNDKANISRYSMPLFVHPRPEVFLAPGQTADDYLTERLHEIGLK